MSLRWTVLGAGTIAPHAALSPSGHLIESPGGPILVDMGPGTLWRLAAAGVQWPNLAALVISHAHLDHFLDFQAMMFSSRAINHGRTKPLPILTGPGLRGYVQKLEGALGKWVRPKGFELEWIEMRAGKTRLGGLDVHVAPMKHHVTSIGVRFEDAQGRSVAYSGDSARCPELVTLCHKADLAVLECSSPDDDPIGGHMTPKDVAQIAAAAHVKQVALVHRYPSLDGVDVEAAVAAHGYDGAVVAARDGQSFQIGAQEHSHG